jgi:hypothetical protein
MRSLSSVSRTPSSRTTERMRAATGAVSASWGNSPQPTFSFVFPDSFTFCRCFPQLALRFREPPVLISKKQATQFPKLWASGRDGTRHSVHLSFVHFAVIHHHCSDLEHALHFRRIGDKNQRTICKAYLRFLYARGGLASHSSSSFSAVLQDKRK